MSNTLQDVKNYDDLIQYIDSMNDAVESRFKMRFSGTMDSAEGIQEQKDKQVASGNGTIVISVLDRTVMLSKNPEDRIEFNVEVLKFDPSDMTIV